jgi:RNAse (barnase) inhibitor barstar
MHKLIIDWHSINTEKEFWDFICCEGKEPSWHGRNLAALNDSWVTGDINQTGPPYEFCFLNCSSIHESIRDLARAVMDIACDSVNENGGSYLAT